MAVFLFRSIQGVPVVAPHSCSSVTESGTARVFHAEVATVTRRRAGEIRAELILRGGECNRVRVIGRFPDVPWKESSRMEPGDVIEFRFRKQVGGGERGRRENAWNPFSFDAYNARRGIAAVVYGEVRTIYERGMNRSAKHRSISRELLGRYGDDDALLVLLAAVMGEDEALSPELAELFKRTGTMHLLVVSGFHVAVVWRVVSIVFGSIGARLTPIPYFIPVEKLASFCGALVALGYTLLTGAEPPAIRAAFALALFVLGRWLGRRTRPIRGLVTAFVAVNVVWPGYLFEASCQLTFSALLGLLVASRVADRLRSGSEDGPGRDDGDTDTSRVSIVSVVSCRVERSFWRGVWEELACAFLYSATVTLYTLPIVIAWFHVVIPGGAFVNTLIAPCFSLIVILGGGAAVFAEALRLPAHAMVTRIAVTATGWVLELLSFLDRSLREFGLAPVEIRAEDSLVIALGLSFPLVALTRAVFRRR